MIWPLLFSFVVRLQELRRCYFVIAWVKCCQMAHANTNYPSLARFNRARYSFIKPNWNFRNKLKICPPNWNVRTWKHIYIDLITIQIDTVFTATATASPSLMNFPNLIYVQQIPYTIRRKCHRSCLLRMAASFHFCQLWKKVWKKSTRNNKMSAYVNVSIISHVNRVFCYGRSSTNMTMVHVLFHPAPMALDLSTKSSAFECIFTAYKRHTLHIILKTPRNLWLTLFLHVF